MCGRFVLSDARWAQDYDIDEADLHLSYNIKPTQGVALVTPKQEVAIAHWWLIPSWHKGDLKEWKATTFNARIEDASVKPTFRAVWKYGRCLIPASGYYEWTGEKGWICGGGVFGGDGAHTARLVEPRDQDMAQPGHATLPAPAPCPVAPDVP